MPEPAQHGAAAEAAEWLAGLAAPGALAGVAQAELRAAVVAALVALRAEARAFALEVPDAQLGPVLAVESMGG